MSWSESENAKFFELLEKYPAEVPAQNRWRKIAAELGTKTDVQVASKAQKQFKKLKRTRKIPGAQERGKKLKLRERLKPDEFIKERARSASERENDIREQIKALEEMKERLLSLGSSSAFFHCAVCELEIRSDIKYVCLDCPAEFCYPCHAHISRDLTLHLHEPAHGGTNLPLPRLVRLESNENADFNHSDFHSSTIDVLKVDIYRF
ncbi:unnamed protein product [Oikopleura dioica]|uniref:Uncharacterized protein n=1 Tax=Oikopleura dioica TaxID=34765 RepID=E4WXJ6_OIKDI|nr:unnamed protein product [Oikopleura dioica]CBY39239.1 unnamed protein product [Oikopleura dioica]